MCREAENIPSEPDPDHAGAGREKSNETAFPEAGESGFCISMDDSRE